MEERTTQTSRPANGSPLRILAPLGVIGLIAVSLVAFYAYRHATAVVPLTPQTRDLAQEAREDLERHRAVVAEPLKVAVRAGTLYNSPPPTQGLASLMILALFERLRVAEAESFDHVHGLVEATKRAFRVRDRFITDPDRLAGPAARFLDKPFLDGEAGKIDRRKAAKWPAPAGEGDTIWMGAADSSGLVVSYIQSLYWEFGSACVLPRTGVLMQNRGASFSLEPGAVNPQQKRRDRDRRPSPAHQPQRQNPAHRYATARTASPTPSIESGRASLAS